MVRDPPRDPRRFGSRPRRDPRRTGPRRDRDVGHFGRDETSRDRDVETETTSLQLSDGQLAATELLSISLVDSVSLSPSPFKSLAHSG